MIRILFEDYAWSAQELAEGESHAAAVRAVLDVASAEIGDLKTALSADQRGVVELTAMLELAAQIARDRLGLSADDFGLAACEVFAAAGSG